MTLNILAALRQPGMRAMAAGAVVAALALAAPARADGPNLAENFVQQNVDRGVQLLTDKSLSASQRRTQIEALLRSVMDIHRLALFCLGKYTATPNQTAAYVKAFEDFTVAKYSLQLGDYGGQSLKVTGSTARSATDHVVEAIILDPSEPAGSQPIKVLFRVLNDGDKYGIVDASIEGVWFGLAQHDDIQGYLTAHNGDVAGLTARLQNITATLDGTAVN